MTDSIVSKLSTAMSVATSAIFLHDKAKEFYTDRRDRYSLSISEKDGIYDAVQAWVVSLPHSKPLKEIAAKTDSKRTVSYSYDGKSTTYVKLGAETIGFSIDAGESGAGSKNDGGGIVISSDGDGFGAPRRLQITARTERGRNLVAAEIERIAESQKSTETPPSIRVHSRWGWDRSEAPLRSLKSVILDEGLKESISQDMARFLDSESDYTERGLPWHRGYLLHGPPGTGKTSLVKGLAHEHGLDIYFLSVADIKSDTDLIDRIHEVRPRSIVLLEDVDSVAASKVGRSDSSEGSGVTTSGLLNVLDGMFTPHGMIGVLTTNHPELLDAAVIRPGRVDVKAHLDYCSEWQIEMLFVAFYGACWFEIDLGGAQISSADVTEVFKRSLYDADTAAHDLLALIASRRPQAVAA